MSVRIVIFGAGASTGSQSKDVPPLTRGLLPQLQEQFPASWGTINGRWVAASGRDFEVLIDRVIENGDVAFAWRLQQDLARYFLQFVPQADSLYRRFATDLGDRDDLIVCTLNYDLLWQRALHSVGRMCQVVGFGTESMTGALPLILPHGSAGLCVGSHARIKRVSGRKTSPFGLIRIANQSADMVLDSAECETAYERNEQNPVMSFIEPRKRVLVAWESLERARAKFAEVCVAAERIAIVGMSYQQHDKHIVDALQRAAGDVLVCTGSGGAEFVGKTSGKVTDLACRWQDAYENVRDFLLT